METATRLVRREVIAHEYDEGTGILLKTVHKLYGDGGGQYLVLLESVVTSYRVDTSTGILLGTLVQRRVMGEDGELRDLPDEWTPYDPTEWFPR